ncbi:hypothetical protein DRO64_01645, partial [Candidatus Bathyarchaeota archaeon]
YLLIKQPKTRPLKFLIIFGLITSIWGISSFMYRMAPVASQTAFYFRLIMISSHLALPTYLLTIINIRERKSFRLQILIIIPVILQVLLICSGDYISSFMFFLTRYGWAYKVISFSPSLTVTGVIYVGYLLGIPAALLILIRKANVPSLRRKYLILLLSFVLFQICGTTLMNALIGLGLLNPIFQLGGLFEFLTFISILYVLTSKEGRVIPSLRNGHDFWKVYSSFLTAFYNLSANIGLGEGFFRFTRFIEESGIKEHVQITRENITLKETDKLDIFELIDKNLKFFAKEHIDQRIVDRYLRVLRSAEKELDWKFDELVRRNIEFLKSSDLIYGLPGCRFYKGISRDKSLNDLDDEEACLRIYKRILLSILSEEPRLIERIRKIFSKHPLSRIIRINRYGEITIGKIKGKAIGVSGNRRILKIIDELNSITSEILEYLLESKRDMDPILTKLKHVLRLNKEKAEKLGIYPKLLGTLATQIPRSQIHKLYSDYLEKLVEEKTRELKKTQERLLKSQRLAAIGEAAAMVGHDLRNPLQAIIYSLYLAKKELDSSPNENLREILRVIEDQVEYMNKIVLDLQYYARPLKPSIVKTNLREILGEIFLTIKVPEDIKVLIEVEDEFTSFPTDPVLIKRVLTNLIMNAIQAMENGGLLRISAVKKDDYAYISVQDTGVGIPEENRSKIFQPLFTTKAKGQGLGLAVCKRIVNALQGSITFHSEVGKGTTFTIKLPFKELKHTSQSVVSTHKKEDWETQRA